MFSLGKSGGGLEREGERERGREAGREGEREGVNNANNIIVCIHAEYDYTRNTYVLTPTLPNHASPQGERALGYTANIMGYLSTKSAVM